MAAGTESPMQRGHHVVPMETWWLQERLFRCWSSQQLVSLPGRVVKAETGISFELAQSFRGHNQQVNRNRGTRASYEVHPAGAHVSDCT